MTGRTTGAVPGRRRARVRPVLRAVLAVVVVLALLSLTPLQATATPAWKTSVTPLLDCLMQNSDGSYTAVVGYSSTYAATTTIPRGPNNVVTPSRYDGPQPTTFTPGTQHGVFALTISADDAAYSNPSWYVDGNTLSGWKSQLSASCPLPTELPADGNDTGGALALVAAGLVGVVVVTRMRRRALAAAGPVSSTAERTDA